MSARSDGGVGFAVYSVNARPEVFLGVVGVGVLVPLTSWSTTSILDDSIQILPFFGFEVREFIVGLLVKWCRMSPPTKFLNLSAPLF
jgi:hypothetical protein